jgi:hypothetical protein
MYRMQVNIMFILMFRISILLHSSQMSNVDDEFADGAAAAAEAEAKQQKEKSRSKHIKFDDDEKAQGATEAADDDTARGQQTNASADDARIRTDPARCKKNKSRIQAKEEYSF